MKIIDLRRTGKGGSSTQIELSIKGTVTKYWYAVGDAAQAIKRIEQDLHDSPPDGWTAWRELWITGGGADASGLLCIDDNPIDSVRMFVEGGGPGHRTPHFMLDLNRSDSRALLAEHLKEDCGKYGTSDL